MTAASEERGCGQADLIPLYLLRALPASEQLPLEAHLTVCADCQQELATLEPVLDSLAYWPTDVLRPSGSLWARLADRIGVQAHGEPPSPEARTELQTGWMCPAPGVSCKFLSTDLERAGITMLVKLAPGASYPSHIHAGVEELYLLHGELWVDDRKFYPGDYRRAEPLTGDHRVWTETGCTCVLITSTRDIVG